MKCIKLLTCVNVLFLMLSCATQKEDDCIAIPKPIELIFGDSNLQDIRFYPFEKGKIWVKTNNPNGDIWEIDQLTGQKTIVEKNKTLYFSRYSLMDQYDSLVWIGGPGQNVLFYDLRSKIFRTLTARHVTRIIPKPDAVFFVAEQGLCYWDRKSKTIHQVEGIPSTSFQRSVMPDDSTVILDGKYTYFFESKQVKEGAFIYGYEHKGDWGSYQAKNGLGLFFKDNSLYSIYKGAIKKLELPHKNVDATKIINQKYWQSEATCFHSFDPVTNELKKYIYKLPAVNEQPMNYEIDSRYIWITRPGQLMVVRLSDNQQFDYPITPGDGYIRTIFDDCNAYILYKNKVMFCSKEDFIKKCTLFDAKQFIQEIHNFKAVVDSLGGFNDTLPSVSLAKLNYLKSRYAGSKNIDITKRLSGMNRSAFWNNIYQFPDGYTACYKDSSMPEEHRISCIKYLIEKHGRLSNFGKVLELKKEYITYFGPLKRVEENFSLNEAIDSVEMYFVNVNRLQKTVSAEDSLYYLKSIALETVVQTHWYCHEGCGGCDYSLVTNRLQRFQTKFPESALVDNCAHYLIHDNYRYDYGDIELLKAQNRDYEDFLKKFPDSDVTAEVQFAIFNNWMSMENKSKIKATGQRFIRTFGTDKRADYVKERIKEWSM